MASAASLTSSVGKQERTCSELPKTWLWATRSSKQLRQPQCSHGLDLHQQSPTQHSIAYLAARRGPPRGTRPWRGEQRGQGSILQHSPCSVPGGSTEVTNWQHLLPLAALGASSCPVRQDLPSQQEMRDESDGACSPRSTRETLRASLSLQGGHEQRLQARRLAGVLLPYRGTGFGNVSLLRWMEVSGE